MGGIIFNFVPGPAGLGKIPTFSENDYFQPRSHLVSIAREGHWSSHLNWLADVPGHFKKGGNPLNDKEKIKSGQTSHIWSIMQSCLRFN